MQAHSHTITRLPVHLPHCQSVYFYPGHEEEALDNAAERNTLLTAWFLLNQTDQEATQFCYTEIPQHYTFNAHTKKWQRRKRGHDKIISRMYSVNPKDGERFYLRLLLLHVPGATSYEALRTINGETVATFKEACTLLNLLKDDTEYDKAMAEAEGFSMPHQLRDLFATLCAHANLSDPLTLWNRYKDKLMEDYIRKHSPQTALRKTLQDIQTILLQSGKMNTVTLNM